MSLERIVAIGGKPGLWKIVATNPKSVIVESLDGKAQRQPVPANAQVSVLNDITLYSSTPDSIYLRDVLLRIQSRYAENLPVNEDSPNAELRIFFNEVAPDHDAERVYPSDMKKIVRWYALIQPLGLITAPAEEETSEPETSEAGNSTPETETKSPNE